MLIHLVPKIICHPDTRVRLVDVAIPEWRLCLTGGVELKDGRPFANKWCRVACPKHERPAKCGILIETEGAVTRFTVEARWAIGTSGIVSHETTYLIDDADHDAASSDMALWGKRRPHGLPDRHPVEQEPALKLDGTVVEPVGLSEFPMPTIDRRHLLDHNGLGAPGNRTLPYKSAFHTAPMLEAS